MNFICKTCPSKVSFSDVKSFVLHFELVHKVTPLSRFICGLGDCCIPSLNEKSYQEHLSLFHPRTESADDVQENLKLKCPVLNCSYVSRVRSTLRSHRRRHHSNFPNGPVVEAFDNATFAEEMQFEVTPAFSADCESVEADLEDHRRGELLEVRRMQVKEKFIHFYLSLNSMHHLPESTIQHMITTQHTLIKEAGSVLTEELTDKLESCNIVDSSNLSKVKDVVGKVVENNVVADVYDPRGCLRSIYMRRKEYHSNQRYVAPRKFKLGLNENNEKRYAHYVPLEETLQCMFQDTSVHNQYVESKVDRASKDGMIRDIYDGSLLMNHPVLSQDPSALGIMLYQDDLEIANVLGSARGQHKITSVYFTLSNLRPWSRTKLKMIKLSMLVAEKDVAYFGLRRSIKPLLEELTSLEENGIVIRGEKLRVVVILLLGDNLGTHMFIGLLENFSAAKFFCRYCEEPRDRWRLRWNGVEEDEFSESEDNYSEDESDDSSSSENDCVDDEDTASNALNEHVPSCNPVGVPFGDAPKRTPASYDACLEKLPKDPNALVKSVKGVVAKCPLNDLKSFHCIGSTPPCIAHDLFEGVIAHDVALAINHFVETTSLTVDHINRRIKSMKFLGRDQGDKPAYVRENMKKLRGHAVQNWNFLRFLPLIISDQVKKDDSVWRMTLQLIKVTRILTSPAIARDSIPDLKNNIHLYLRMRVTCFPNVKLRPKHHFLEHYPELIERFGCLMRVGTLAFESKHRFFKNAASSKKNFKNITKTLSEEHQLCESAQSIEALLTSFPTLEKPSPYHAVHLCPGLRDCIQSFFGPEFLNAAAVSNAVQFRGIWYRKGEAVVTAWDSDRAAQLCLIDLVITYGKTCYISGQRCRAELSPDLEVFIVQKLPTFTVKNVERIPDYLSYPIYSLNYEDVVVLKHIVVPPKN